MRYKLFVIIFSLLIASAVSFDMARNTQAKMDAPPRAETISVAPLPAAPQALPIEPLLTDMARRVTAKPDLSLVNTGQKLNVKLDIPAGGSSTRRPATRPLTRPGVRDPRTGLSGTYNPRIPTVPRPPSRNLVDDIPCHLLPTGCPGPINQPGTGGVPGFELKNFEVHAKWGVYQSANGRPGAALIENKQYISPMSQGPSQQFILNALNQVEYTGAQRPAKPFMIVATITVTADKTVLSVPPSTTKVSSAEVPVEVPVSLAALEVPTVFVLFMGKNFTEAAAIYFPANSTFKLPSKDARARLLGVVSNLLGTYNSTASSLSTFAGMTSFLTGLDVLNKALALPHVDVKELKDAESNLNNDDFIHRSPYTSVNDSEVEDESSSLFLFGVQGTGAEFYQHRDFGGMKFTARTGPEMVVLIRDFVAMSSEPAGRVEGKTFTASKTPNESLSSFKWRREQVAARTR